MLSKIKSFSTIGIDGVLIDIEVDINNGLPSFETVGLADTTIKESKERVRSAIKNSGYEYPIYKIIVNLAPADIKKIGSGFDLGIAVGILSATDQLNVYAPDKFIVLGELSLNGEVRKVNGILPMLIEARKLGYNNFIVPKENEKEASFIDGINVYCVASLRETINFLKDNSILQPVQTSNFSTEIVNNVYQSDMKYVKGQKIAKRALEISASGGHNMIMIGSPGSGKTMLAKCLPSIMPDMTFEEALEVTKIHSVAGTLNNEEGIIKQRPFRTPHHTSTLVALTGGGAKAKPGEISLAHNGVLFLDEMPEYNRNTLETLRQPLEDGTITVSRNALTVTYPANFTLIASMNPCPCGYYGSKTTECKCTPTAIHKYLNKLSGPLMDRIDLHVEVDNITYQDIYSNQEEESSQVVKERVNKARKIQSERFNGTKTHNNANMTVAQIKKFCKLDKECESVLKNAFEKLGLTARAHDRILKVARTIADLDNSENIKLEHIMEALSYRNLDKKYWV